MGVSTSVHRKYQQRLSPRCENYSLSHENLRRLFTPFWFCFQISRLIKHRIRRSIQLLLMIDSCWTIVLKTGCKKWKMFIQLNFLIDVKYLTLLICVKMLNKPPEWKKHCERRPRSFNSVISFFSKPRASIGSSTTVSSSAGLSTVPTSNNVSLVDCMMINNSTVHAEIRWALKVVLSKFSKCYCDGVTELFGTMFPDNCISKFDVLF